MKTNTSSLFDRLFLPAIFFLFSFAANSQAPDSSWFFHFGGTDNEIGFDAIEGEDGIFYLVGKTKSYGNGGDDAYVIKLDNNGGLIWEKTYGTSLGEQISSVCPALYGGFVMTGYTTTNENSSEIWLLWIDEDGDSLYSRTYGSYTSDQGLCIRPNYDQGYILTARMSVYQWGDQVYLMKLDQTGDTLWTKTYGSPNQDYGQVVAQATDGGYIIAGRTYASYTPESGDAWVLKTDSYGDTTWTKKYGGNDEDIFYAVVETDDGYIFAGQTWSYGAGLIDVYTVRTNYYGDTIWTRTFGGAGADYCYNMSKAENGNFILAGYSDSFNTENDVYLLEIDIDGNLIWEANYGLLYGNELAYGCRPISDGGFIITGKEDYYLTLKDELFALKLGPGSSGMVEINSKQTPSVSNFPNPFETITTIFLDIPVKTEANLRIYNAAGILVETLIDGESVTGQRKIDWDATELGPGLYFCKLSAGCHNFIRKMIITR